MIDHWHMSGPILLSTCIGFIEVRDSPNGIFGPWAWWSGGLARWESCWDAVTVAVTVTWKLENSLICNFHMIHVLFQELETPNAIHRSVLSSQYWKKRLKMIFCTEMIQHRKLKFWFTSQAASQAKLSISISMLNHLCRCITYGRSFCLRWNRTSNMKITQHRKSK